MYPRILHVYGSIWIHSYGLMIVLGLATFLWLVYTHPQRKRLMDGDTFWDLMLWGIVLGIIGGRTLYLISHYDTIASWHDMIYVWDGGLNVMGSIIAIVAGLAILLRWYRIAVISFFDMVCLYAPLLQSIARIGCFFAGCCSGLVAPQPAWYTITYVHQASLTHALGVPLYPTQIVDSLCSLLLFGVLRWGVYKRIPISGIITAWYLAGAGYIRFGIGFWRHRDVSGGYGIGEISFDQFVALGVAIGATLWGIYLLARHYKRTRST